MRFEYLKYGDGSIRIASSSKAQGNWLATLTSRAFALAFPTFTWSCGSPSATQIKFHLVSQCLFLPHLAVDLSQSSSSCSSSLNPRGVVFREAQRSSLCGVEEPWVNSHTERTSTIGHPVRGNPSGRPSSVLTIWPQQMFFAIGRTGSIRLYCALGNHLSCEYLYLLTYDMLTSPANGLYQRRCNRGTRSLLLSNLLK